MNNLNQARNLYSRQKYKEARRLFDQEYSASQAVEALYGSALCDYELNDFQNSLKKLNQILTTHPNNHLVYNQIGMIAFKVGDIDTAELMFNKSIEIFPDFESGHRNISKIFAHRKQMNPIKNDFIDTNNEWWSNAHSKNIHLWITGNRLKNIVDYFDIEPRGVILNVGVGENWDSLELMNKGNIVDGVDVTEHAFRINFRNRYIIFKDILPSNEYDFIIWSLVVQHISDEVFENELPLLIDALNDNGTLLMQYYEDDIKNRGIIVEQQGGVDRTKEYMENLINSHSAFVSYYKYVEKYKWGIMHIQKKKDKGI
jgi:tetratricopeptide (TPR) repeat protein